MSEEEHDPLEDVEPLPRVQEMGWSVIPKPPAVQRKVEVKTAAIDWSLRPWSAKPKKSMVTMSDLEMDARPRGGAKPARRKQKPKLLRTEDEE